MRELQLIAALDNARVIGHQGTIPWHYRADLQRFKRLTLNHAIIMGRLTFESLGRPLPKRHNIVVSRQGQNQGSTPFPGCARAPSLEEALAQAYAVDDAPFVIGGAGLYAAALPMATTLHLTYVPGTHPGDTFFPQLPAETFAQQDETQCDTLRFVTYRRIDAPVR